MPESVPKDPHDQIAHAAEHMGIGLDIVESAPGAGSRPWLGVYFACANKYVKVFRSADGQSYTARCPKCGDATRFQVGSGGVSTRFFEVKC